MIEFDGVTPELDHCACLIDEDLKQGNTDYATHRASTAGLAPPKVRALRSGSFHDWMRSQGKLGGQHKVPRVLADQALRARLDALVQATHVTTTRVS